MAGIAFENEYVEVVAPFTAVTDDLWFRGDVDSNGESLAYVSNGRYAMAMDAVEDHVARSLLRSARARLGLSQTRFADVLGIAQPTLSAYDSWRRQPTLPTLLRMLNRAGLDLRLELVERDDHESRVANGDVDARCWKHASDPSESATSPRDDENRRQIVYPTRLRGKSSVATAAVADLGLGAGFSRPHRVHITPRADETRKAMFLPGQLPSLIPVLYTSLHVASTSDRGNLRRLEFVPTSCRERFRIC